MAVAPTITILFLNDSGEKTAVDYVGRLNNGEMSVPVQIINQHPAGFVGWNINIAYL